MAHKIYINITNTYTMINQALILQALPLPKVFQYRNYKVKQIKLMQNDNSIGLSTYKMLQQTKNFIYIMDDSS